MKKRSPEGALAITLLICFALFLLFPPSFFQVTGEATTGTASVQLTINATPESPQKEIGRNSGGTPGVFSVSVDPNSFNFGGIFSTGLTNVVVGDVLHADLRVENNGQLTQDFKVEVNQLFVSVTPSSFTIRPGEMVVLRLTLEVVEPGVSIARLLLTSSYLQLQVPIVVNARSPGADFDVMFYMPREQQRIQPGEGLYSKVILHDLVDGEATVQYSLRDAYGSPVVRDSLVADVYDGVTFEHVLRLPSSLKEGGYVFAVVVEHQGEVVSDSVLVLVTREAEPHETLPSPVQPTNNKEIVVAFLFILCLTLGHYFLVKHQKGLNL